MAKKFIIQKYYDNTSVVLYLKFSTSNPFRQIYVTDPDEATKFELIKDCFEYIKAINKVSENKIQNTKIVSFEYQIKDISP